MSGANSWLQRQRKSELVEIAQSIGLKEYVHSRTFLSDQHANSPAPCEGVIFLECLPNCKSLGHALPPAKSSTNTRHLHPHFIATNLSRDRDRMLITRP